MAMMCKWITQAEFVVAKRVSCILFCVHAPSRGEVLHRFAENTKKLLVPFMAYYYA